MCTFTIPWPPSANRNWRAVNGRVISSKAARRYRGDVEAAVADQRVGRHEGPLLVKLRVHPPDGRKRDIDNLAKAPLDALQHAGVMQDDAQVQALLIVRGEKTPGGSITVSIGPVGDSAGIW